MHLAVVLTLIIGGFALMWFREGQLQRRYPGSDLSRFNDHWPAGLPAFIGALMFISGCAIALLRL